MSDHNEHKINEAILNYVNGGTKEENEEIREYAKRHYPLYDQFDPNSAVSFFILDSFRLYASRFSDDKPNMYLVDGQTIDHPTMMAMLREVYGD